MIRGVTILAVPNGAHRCAPLPATPSARSGQSDRSSVFAHLTDAGAPAASDRIESDPSPSDESLLAGLVANDVYQEAAFVQRFQGRVYGLARLLMGETLLAEDVAHEAFLGAWRHAPDFDPRRGSVTTWLLTITRNLAIDALRRRQAVPVDLALSGLEPGGLAKAPDELAEDTDAGSRLREAIGHLPPEQRRAVMLAFFYGQTAREISTTERIPVSTARIRIRLGMTELRSALDGADPLATPFRRGATAAKSPTR